MWEFNNLWERHYFVVNWGFSDSFNHESQTFQPLPIGGDYENVSLYADGQFRVKPGWSQAELEDPYTAAALIAPWPYEDIEVATQFYGEATNDHTPEIYLRWVDEDNYLVVRFFQLEGVWQILVGAVIDGDLHPTFLEYETTLTSLYGATIRANITGGRITMLAGGEFGQVPLVPSFGTDRTDIHKGATKGGIGARLWTGSFNYLALRIRGFNPDSTHFVVNTHPAMDGPPTLTAGGDNLVVKAGLGLAQLLAKTTHLRLRRRPASLGGQPLAAVPLVGVLQPVAGSPDGEFGHEEGVGDDARFNYPISVRVYRESLYVADYGNAAIRVIDLNGPLAGTVATVVSTEDMPLDVRIRLDAEDRVSDKPNHIDFDEISDKMLIVGEHTIADVTQVTDPTNRYVEVLRKSDQFGSAVIGNGGYTAVVKYPIGDYTNGWWYLTLVQTDPLKPRGSLSEPGPPAKPYWCDYPFNTIAPTTIYWRDGPYAGDGGMVKVPNRDWHNADALIVSHNYVYPSQWGLGSVNLLGGSKHMPDSYCPIIPEPPVWPPPAGQLRNSASWETGLSERELTNGPDDVSLDFHPTAVAPVYNSDHGIIQKYTINPEDGNGAAFVLDVNMSHSRGLQYLPTQSVAYNQQTGIYYFAVGRHPDSSTEILGTAPNRIVALDLYAPDYVTGDLELPPLTPFVERVPDPVETDTTFPDPEITAIGADVGATGGVLRLPIGHATMSSETVTLADEDGNVLIDEDGNVLIAY